MGQPPLPQHVPGPPGQPARPFGRFDDLFAADPYPLAAAGLGLFRSPKIDQSAVQTWLRSLVVEQAPTMLGLTYGVPPALEASEVRILLIWEHALVAARTLEGSDHVSRKVLLLAPAVITKPYAEQLAILQGDRTVDLR